MTNFPKALLFLSAILYWISLFVPAFGKLPGYGAVYFGAWLFVTIPLSGEPFGYALCWSANLWLAGAFISIFADKPARAALLAGIGTALSLTFLLMTDLDDLRIGYVLWVCSMFVTAIGASLRARSNRRSFMTIRERLIQDPDCLEVDR